MEGGYIEIGVGGTGLLVGGVSVSFSRWLVVFLRRLLVRGGSSADSLIPNLFANVRMASFMRSSISVAPAGEG